VGLPRGAQSREEEVSAEIAGISGELVGLNGPFFRLTGLWPRRKLAGTVHGAVFDVRYAAIDQQIPIASCHSECLGARPHAGIRLYEVIVVHARNCDPLAAGQVFQPGNGIPVISDLDGCPPLVAAVFEVVNDRTAQSSSPAVLRKRSSAMIEYRTPREQPLLWSENRRAPSGRRGVVVALPPRIEGPMSDGGDVRVLSCA
jgi:hypothetical protein